MDNNYSWIMKDIGELEDQGDLLRYRVLREYYGGWKDQGELKKHTMGLLKFQSDLSDIGYKEI